MDRGSRRQCGRRLFPFDEPGQPAINARHVSGPERSMAGKELGNKHLCFKCGTKFYDFKKPEPICPKCGADQRQGPPPPKAPPAERRPKAQPKPAPEEAERTVDDEVATEEEDDEKDDDEKDKDDEDDDA
jgi:hypothetical protein